MKLSEKYMLFALLGVTYLAVFIQAHAPSLDVDGIHYAAVAREIALSNRWLLPFDPVTNTPHYWHFPMTIWPTALFFQWFGVTPAVAKLFSSVMTLVAVGGIFVLGRTLAGPWVGWFSGMGFLLTDHVMKIARQCRPDLPLIAFITWAFVGLALAAKGSKRWYLLTGAASFGAIMTKEFVGLVPLVAAVAYLVLRRNWRELIQPAFLAAWAVAILPVLAWMGAEQLFYQDTLWNNYYAQNFSHLLQRRESLTPWYYYGWAILDKYWYFLPLALAGGWLAWGKIRRAEEPRWLLIFLWAVAFPLGFSLAHHKVHYYILPTYAATALWVGLACDRWISNLWKQRLFWGTTALAFIAAVGLAFSPISVHPARYEVSVRWAPLIDPIVRQAPGQVVVVRQDVASLLIYSDAITRVTSAHNWPHYGEFLGATRYVRRYCFIGHREWDLLEPEAQARWTILIDDGERLFAVREAAT